MTGQWLDHDRLLMMRDKSLRPWRQWEAERALFQKMPGRLRPRRESGWIPNSTCCIDVARACGQRPDAGGSRA